jgi:methylated-DNA-[protein]-cysteine S-methyltransferase
MRSARRPSRPSLLRLATSWGAIRVEARSGRIVGCALPRRDAGGRPPRVLSAEIRSGRPGDRRVLEAARTYVEACLAGRRAPVPPLALPAGAPFDRAVWRALRRIGHGRTMAYGELAAAAGRPRAARAAGAACGRNPLPLFVPCHRVTPAGGGLGGFSGGLAWKRALLAAEASRP